jgi:hypothetical protein
LTIGSVLLNINVVLTHQQAHMIMQQTSRLLCAALIAAPTLILAEGDSKTSDVIIPEVQSNTWEYNAYLYGWLASLKGKVGINGLPAQDVELPLDTILENLDALAYFGFEGNKGNWGYFTDVQYLKLSGKNAASPQTIKMSLEQLIIEFAVQYRFYESAQTNAYVYGAAQYNYYASNLDVDGFIANVDASGSQNWIDPAIGVKVRHQFNNKWSCDVLGEVGGFGVSSDLTWQALGKVNYHINECWDVAVGYRYQYVDYEKDGFVFDSSTQGAVIGVTYNF